MSNRIALKVVLHLLVATFLVLCVVRLVDPRNHEHAMKVRVMFDWPE
jgi:hypothetical protein